MKNQATTAKTADCLSEQLLQARKSSVQEFGNIEHRLEFVDEIDGVEYINDSKATDVNSTWYSLEFMTKPVVWIVGASEMEVDYTLFIEPVQNKVKAIVCLGGNASEVAEALINNVERFGNASTIDDAVQKAASYAAKGDTVLFSPTCSNFDKFQNYKDRGQRFRKAVEGLK